MQNVKFMLNIMPFTVFKNITTHLSRHSISVLKANDPDV